MFKRNKMRVVPVEEYTDYSEREKKFEEIKYATRKDVLVMGAVPVVGAAGLFAYNKASSATTATMPFTVEQLSTVSYQINPVPDTPPVLQPEVVTDGVVQTGYIADKSLEMLANILDPLLDIMVAISFPIASVIMVGACFLFMLGNSERAWTMIMNAGLGYCLIQLSPLFLDILRTVGSAV